MGDESNFNKLILDDTFVNTLEEIKKLKIVLPESSPQDMDFSGYTFPEDGQLVINVEEMKSYKLDAINGEKISKKSTIVAFDESINKFSGLQGTAFLTSHSLIIHGVDDFLPSNFITFYFYTRSNQLINRSKTGFIKLSKDPEVDSKVDYVRDRLRFMKRLIPENSICFIDGPLVGGQLSSYTNELNDILLEKNILPIFFVKNSLSNLITDNIKPLTGRYNSDMDWAYQTLRHGERTCFFKYEGGFNKDNSKILCYIKPFEKVSPQRIEIHFKSYIKFKNIISDILDLTYYLIIAQGDISNSQVRSIAIAEKYARSTIKLYNINGIMDDMGVVGTFNMERGMNF